jgi:membrane protein
MPDTEQLADAAREQAPSTLVELVDRTSRHNVLMLAAGLAFFGLISIGPAVGVGFGLIRVLVSPEAADSLADTLEGAFDGQFGFADLFDQMEDRAGRYAGIGLLVLLWPATTLASGWTRTLDDIAGTESGGGVRGLRGRVRGLIPGGILLGAVFLLLGIVTTGATLIGGEQLLLLPALGVFAVVVQVGLNLAVYRWLPTERAPWSRLWPGALWSSAGVILASLGLLAANAFGEGLADQYPPALTTSIVLGLWLYAANSALLLGAEYNEVRADRR